MVGLTPEHEPEQASKQLGDREGTPTGPITLSVHTLQLEPPLLRELKQTKQHVWISIDPFGRAHELEVRLRSSRLRPASLDPVLLDVHELLPLSPGTPLWEPMCEALNSVEEQDSDVYFVLKAGLNAEHPDEVIHVTAPGLSTPVDAVMAAAIDDEQELGLAHVNLKDLLKREHEPTNQAIDVLDRHGKRVASISVTLTALASLRYARGAILEQMRSGKAAARAAIAKALKELHASRVAQEAAWAKAQKGSADKIEKEEVAKQEELAAARRAKEEAVARVVKAAIEARVTSSARAAAKLKEASVVAKLKKALREWPRIEGVAVTPAPESAGGDDVFISPPDLVVAKVDEKLTPRSRRNRIPREEVGKVKTARTPAGPFANSAFSRIAEKSAEQSAKTSAIPGAESQPSRLVSRLGQGNRAHTELEARWQLWQKANSSWLQEREDLLSIVRRRREGAHLMRNAISMESGTPSTPAAPSPQEDAEVWTMGQAPKMGHPLHSPGWHAVLDRRCGPTGQLLFYNEETEELLTTMPGAAAVEQKRLLAAEFARTRGDLEGFLAGAAQAQTSALLQKIERLEQMQRDRIRSDRLRFELEQDVRSSGVEGGWNGYNALVQGVKRAARSHPLGNRQKVQTAEVTRMEYERYVALQSLWQYMYCGLCLMCVTVVVLLLASVHIARRL
eukprot:jgi/Chrpa1/22929/Chrysochromulina_OHIO_Genome00000430-RA